MSLKQRLPNTQQYHQTLNSSTIPFPCRFCETPILAKDYEGHCKQHHGIKPREECVWCQGQKKWKFGEKEHRIATHVLECFDHFKSDHIRSRKTRRTKTFVSASIQFPDTPLCEDLDLCGHSRLFNLPPAAYELFQLCPEYPMELTYQNPYIHLAASYIRKFVAEKETTDFFHVMIRAPAITVALQAMGDTITFLPFSCWCDGGSEKVPYLRQHRHLIAVAPKGIFFESFWYKIETEVQDVPFSYYEHIRSAMHLLLVLASASLPTSFCPLSQTEGKHFYVFTPLPKDFQWILALQWDGGILDLLNLIVSRWDRKKFMDLPLVLKDGQWFVKMRYLETVPIHRVLPVSPKFKPSKTPTKYSIHLMEGQKFYFDVDPDLEELDDDTWHQKQQDLGNTFYKILGEKYFKLTPGAQKYVSDVMPIWKSNKKLKMDHEKTIQEKNSILLSLLQKNDELNKTKRELSELQFLKRKLAEDE